MNNKIVCTQCLYNGKAKKYTKGSFIFELVLWLCFIIPGLLYSIYRATSKVDICPMCKSKNIVPEYSPMGKKLLEK